MVLLLRTLHHRDTEAQRRFESEHWGRGATVRWRCVDIAGVIGRDFAPAFLCVSVPPWFNFTIKQE
jgi:hypothetical protein